MNRETGKSKGFGFVTFEVRRRRCVARRCAHISRGRG
jgi:hypothetical protein